MTAFTFMGLGGSWLDLDGGWQYGKWLTVEVDGGDPGKTASCQLHLDVALEVSISLVRMCAGTVRGNEAAAILAERIAALVDEFSEVISR